MSASEKYADAELDRLRSAISKLDDDEECYWSNDYNHGGQMMFLPKHQGCGFEGFAEDDYWMPLWRDGSDRKLTVHGAIVKAFKAGAKWSRAK